MKTKILNLVLITSLGSQASQLDHLYIWNIDSRHTLETELLKFISKFTVLNFTLLLKTNRQELLFLADYTKRYLAYTVVDSIWSR